MHYLFIDESGNHGLTHIDPAFPIILICGVIIEHSDYLGFYERIKALKLEIFGREGINLHSYDIRKKRDPFHILKDETLCKRFIDGFNRIVTETNYCIISSGIHKERYIERHGKLNGDVYEQAISFILERCIFWLDDVKQNDKSLKIVIEKRGKKEDKKLADHINTVKNRGTRYVNPDRFKYYLKRVEFHSKLKNISGLQLADLLAYPIARHIITPEKENLPFDLIKPKLYCKGSTVYGMKVYPT